MDGVERTKEETYFHGKLDVRFEILDIRRQIIVDMLPPASKVKKKSGTPNRVPLLYELV
jgi:hypothetical protein